MAELTELLDIMRKLRDPDGGCPWDLEQSFETIAPYTIEEAYEVDDAIARADWPALRDELGDLLLQVVYHSQLASEAGHFEIGAVIASICEKLVRRHPHVFGDAEPNDSAAQVRAWDEFKAAERAGRAAREGREAGVLDDVPRGLPALLRAAKLQRRAQRAGVDDPEADLGLPPADANDEAFGDFLFASVRVARAHGIDPEAALREASRRFEARVEDRLREQGN